MPHKPVLLNEVLTLLKPQKGEVVLDGTLGSGGHAYELAKAVGTTGKFIGLDQDPASLQRCSNLTREFPHVILEHANFSRAREVLEHLNVSALDAVLLDIGFSSEQIEDPARGLSFEREGPLDMRMNPELIVTARHIVNRFPEHKLEEIFRNYGEERHASRFAHVIAQERRKQTIETTAELIKVLSKALPARFLYEKGQRAGYQRRHFATRIFQALRITVNDELNQLNEGLQNLWQALRSSGRLAVITFHSLEDRIVKQTFRLWQNQGEGTLLTKKPLTASREEMRENPRSRSAKLRGIQKL